MKSALTLLLAFVFLSLLSAQVAPQPSPGSPDSPALSGEWEGTMQMATRPVVFLVRFSPDTPGEAKMEILGRRDLPVTVQRRGGHVLLQHSGLRFDGEVRGRAIAGTGTDGEEKFPFTLEKLPEYPAPRNRVEAWEQDLETVVSRFLKHDRSFSPKAREQFRQQVKGVRANLARLSDAQIIVKLSQAVALSGNAHTTVYLLRNRTSVRRLPLRLGWFQNELYVLRAAPEHRDLLGQRVVAIGTTPIQQARRLAATLQAGLDNWKDYNATYLLTSPDVLHGLGIAARTESVSFTFAAADGRKTERTLAPLPLARKNTSTESWWDLSPAYTRHTEGADWPHVLSPGGLPLYLRHPEKNYWFEHDAAAGLLYVQYNRAQDAGEADPFSAFAEGVLQAIRLSSPRIFVFDLRFNTGGNSGVAKELIEQLCAAPELANTRFYTVLSATTFSAGITAAAQLRECRRGQFIGEPVGDSLDLWSEGGTVVLPNSKLPFHFANGFHSYSKVDRPELKPYFADMSVDSVQPDSLVRITWADYLAKRDPVMQAILDERP